MDLLKEFKKNIDRYKLFKKGEKLVVGVSGGVDSVVLLSLLKNIQREYSFTITVAHLNHGLRKEANYDQDFVEELASNHGFESISKKIKPPKANIEEKGRDERYKFFNEVLYETDSDSIVTAHNKNDQAETVILNLTRGAGVRGLKGITQITGNVKRPLLSIRKEDILTYAKKNKLKWREDLTNKDPKYSRNRVRNKVIIELKEINPNAVDNIHRSADLLRESKELLDELVDKKLEKVLVKEGESVELDVNKLKNMSDSLKKEIIFRFISKISPKNIDRSHIESILELLDKKGTKEISLPLGFTVTKIYDRLKIGFLEEVNEKIEKKELKDSTNWLDWVIEKEKSKEAKKNSRFSIYINPREGNLFVRSKKEGDFIYLKGDANKKKLSDILIDEKVPKKERESHPIIVNEEDEVIWVIGIRMSDKYRAKVGSKSINLRVEK